MARTWDEGQIRALLADWSAENGNASPRIRPTAEGRRAVRKIFVGIANGDGVDDIATDAKVKPATVEKVAEEMAGDHPDVARIAKVLRRVAERWSWPFGWIRSAYAFRRLVIIVVVLVLAYFGYGLWQAKFGGRGTDYGAARQGPPAASQSTKAPPSAQGPTERHMPQGWTPGNGRDAAKVVYGKWLLGNPNLPLAARKTFEKAATDPDENQAALASDLYIMSGAAYDSGADAKEP